MPHERALHALLFPHHSIGRDQAQIPWRARYPLIRFRKQRNLPNRGARDAVEPVLPKRYPF
jgi:hypothetical protein